MFKTEDGVINITVANNVSSVVFQPSDWSLINIPIDMDKAKILADNLYNMPSHRHVVLLLNRHRRKDRIKGLSCLSAFDDKKWKFMESVNIAYGKPSTCSNNGFLPLAEQGYIFYKGESPDAKQTKWASNDEYQNATNDWNLFPQAIENVYFKHTYYQKFSWDLQLILMSLVGCRENSRFIYGVVDNNMTSTEIRSFYLFCVKYKVSAEVIVNDISAAEYFLGSINKISSKILNEVNKL